MKRRQLLTSGIAASAAVIAPAVHAKKTIKWKMVTTWPKNFPGLGTGANNMARMINDMSGGRLKVKVYGANELVGAMEVFDAVRRGTAQLGHSGAYYWKGKTAAAQFFTSVPFGLTAQEMNGWLYYGGGMELWEETYKPFYIIPLAAGNTGVQMGGWFNKKIDTLADVKGLKMRIPGLGGEVLKRAGGVPVVLPGSEIFTSLKSGAIDATEWVGPYNDLAFGLHKAAKYYYYPGWHEPGSTMEALVNRKALEALPKDLRQIVRTAATAANMLMLAEYTARNNDALETLVNKHKVTVLRFPEPVLAKLRELSDEVVRKTAESDALCKKVYQSFRHFRDQSMAWHNISEREYLNIRGQR
jgi:TRAP-type mannitol/chloroaromatic compound transport system substrate-binding protein